MPKSERFLKKTVPAQQQQQQQDPNKNKKGCNHKNNMTVHLLRLLTTAPTPASRAVTVAARCEEERGEDLGGGEEDWGGQCPLGIGETHF